MALSGDTVHTVELRRAPQLLEGRERDSVAAAAGISPGMLPQYKPVLGTIAVAPDSWLWVAVTEGERLKAWDLFDDAGRYLGRAASPEPMAMTPTPLVTADAVIGVVEDEFGSQWVVRYRVLPTGMRNGNPMTQRTGAILPSASHIDSTGAKLPQREGDR